MPICIIEENVKFQLEISENKDVIFFFSIQVHRPQVKIPAEWKGHSQRSGDMAVVLTLPLTSSMTLAFALLSTLAFSLHSGDNCVFPSI